MFCLCWPLGSGIASHSNSVIVVVIDINHVFFLVSVILLFVLIFYYYGMVFFPHSLTCMFLKIYIYIFYVAGNHFGPVVLLYSDGKYHDLLLLS